MKNSIVSSFVDIKSWTNWTLTWTGRKKWRVQGEGAKDAPPPSEKGTQNLYLVVVFLFYCMRIIQELAHDCFNPINSSF